MSPPKVEAAAKLRDFLRKEIKGGALLRALAVIGPLVIAYFFSREPASFAGGASGIAEERVANVIMGGVFGLIPVALIELVWRRGGAGKVGLAQ